MGLESKIIETDVLIIGGGTAGCYSAITIAEANPEVEVLITEKAHIKRSGCLAQGVNAINAHINKGQTPDSYVDYVKKDSKGIIRDDLVYSIAKGLNKVTKKIEQIGLPILKDEEGNYISRGRSSVKINGENIKPLLANEVESKENVTVLNRVNIIDYIIKEDQVIGAYGISLDKDIFYTIYAKAVICTTGGAAGLYKPNNPGFSRHKMWYSPFNTGAGYAMGIRAGAEMTTFEMRFIALRCKDTIAPTGTIASGVGARQVNKKGIDYVKRYRENSTPMRLYATVQENKNGLGPCYLETKGIDKEAESELYKAYLNMSLAQTLKWVETGKGPSVENVEIEGTEPYIVGGHTASGYWIDNERRTTIKGLYAAGDVAGGSPKKYVTGCFVEGEIAAYSALEYIKDKENFKLDQQEIEDKLNGVNKFFNQQDSIHTIEEVEEAMQKVMDQYAGGISVDYVIELDKLQIAKKRMDELLEITKTLKANDLHELLFIFELFDRLYVCKTLIHHLETRKESRWYCYHQNKDYPQRDDENWMKYVNSVYKDGEFQTIYRNLVGRDDIYEH